MLKLRSTVCLSSAGNLASLVRLVYFSATSLVDRAMAAQIVAHKLLHAFVYSSAISLVARAMAAQIVAHKLLHAFVSQIVRQYIWCSTVCLIGVCGLVTRKPNV